jgi:hypothetical protein
MKKMERAEKKLREACRRLKIKHIRTKPYTPKTNGKPNALSKRRCANGPTQELIRPQIKEPRSCRFGRIIGVARTAA